MKIGKTLQELAIEIETQFKMKKDFLAPTTSIRIEADEADGVVMRLDGTGEFKINDIAHEQIAEHAGIPKKYYDRMRAETPQLLANNVETWFRKYPAVRMVRTLGDKSRAFLSDKFQPFDNYDFAGAALPILRDRKLKIASCDVTEKKLYLKAIDEKLYHDVPVGHKMGDGSHKIFDTCAPVVIMSNSEVGYGRLVIETGVYTSACTNLAMFAKGGMRRTHVGARHLIADGIDSMELEEVMSSATKRKTMEALWMQARDVIAAAFDKETFAKRCEILAVAAGHKISGKVEKVVAVAGERFGLNDGERESVLKHLIEGGNLSQYGLHAAITRASQDVESYDRATELEYLGGKVVELPRGEWERLAEVA